MGLMAEGPAAGEAALQQTASKHSLLLSQPYCRVVILLLNTHPHTTHFPSTKHPTLYLVLMEMVVAAAAVVVLIV